MKSFKAFITEEFVDGFESRNKYNEIFVNPTTSELKQFREGCIRFIIDLENKQVYIWDGESCIHYYIIKKLHRLGLILPLPESSGDAIYIDTMSKYIQAVTSEGVLDSDLYNGLAYNYGSYSEKEREGIKTSFGELLNSDMGWLDKYPMFSSSKIKNLISNYDAIVSRYV